jgi:hypothetical protein
MRWPGRGRDCQHLDSDVLANKESASTRSAISVPQGCWLIGTEFSAGTGRACSWPSRLGRLTRQASPRGKVRPFLSPWRDQRDRKMYPYLQVHRPKNGPTTNRLLYLKATEPSSARVRSSSTTVQPPNSVRALRHTCPRDRRSGQTACRPQQPEHRTYCGCSSRPLVGCPTEA